ncbi:hypothetical protein BMR07_17505 [Methylococcaceae bacterium CS1]|nr:hypothetical protein BMR10_16485 [Methylococcaceae bacterium CS4]TXK93404.1 hypothetical protein BMR11_17010 [Methylococcaceae bacterium CS5]TXL02286.1 hypothetical protein BMR09_17200 [Methylococcaceae bacterium CS3]TXL02568.1 hypothetical protein BMR07_17505 [Methylococcaceae bacterium CS1]TXL03307.1 hypothetical protein BMR08_17270 [Methylococcaceae bacterium CS2]
MKFTKPALIIMAAAITACADKAEKSVDITDTPPPVADCVFQNQQAAPGWICDEPVPGLDIQAVGIAEKSQAGHGYMKDMAKAAALGHLAEQFKVKVGKMVKQYIGTTGIGSSETVDAAANSTIKTISSKTLEGVKIYKTRIGPEGRMYVLAGMDTLTTKALVETAVKTSLNNDQALWQEFKAQKSHDEMAAGIAAMED